LQRNVFISELVCSSGDQLRPRRTGAVGASNDATDHVVTCRKSADIERLVKDAYDNRTSSSTTPANQGRLLIDKIDEPTLASRWELTVFRLYQPHPCD